MKLRAFAFFWCPTCRRPMWDTRVRIRDGRMCHTVHVPEEVKMSMSMVLALDSLPEPFMEPTKTRVEHHRLLIWQPMGLLKSIGHLGEV